MASVLNSHANEPGSNLTRVQTSFSVNTHDNEIYYQYREDNLHFLRIMLTHMKFRNYNLKIRFR